MQVGDLVRLKVSGNVLAGTWLDEDVDIAAGVYLIYTGEGSWAGWGRFLLPDGSRGQIQLTDVEVACK